MDHPGYVAKLLIGWGLALCLLALALSIEPAHAADRTARTARTAATARTANTRTGPVLVIGPRAEIAAPCRTLAPGR
jgi:hypothetical protein